MDSTPQVIGFTPEQAPAVKRLIEEVMRDQRGKTNRPEVVEPPGAKARTYLARAPSGGIGANAPGLTGTGTGLTDDSLSHADCHIYRLSNTYPGASGAQALQKLPQTVRVFNPWTTAVPAYGLTIVVQDEFGTWLVGSDPAGGSGGGGTGITSDPDGLTFTSGLLTVDRCVFGDGTRVIKSFGAGNDLAIDRHLVLVCSATSTPWTLTGLANNVTGPLGQRMVVIINADDFATTLVIKPNNIGSSANNRIITAGSADYNLTQGKGLWLYYDTSASRWRFAGG